MHNLTKNYSPTNTKFIRHGLVNNMENLLIPKYLPENKKILKTKFDILIKESKQLPQNKDSYGLIHADFGDGNFAIDYDNGNEAAEKVKLRLTLLRNNIKMTHY